MQSHQSTFRKIMLTLLATLTFVRTADILKGVQIPENPDKNFIADKAFCFGTLQNYCGSTDGEKTLKECYNYVILTWVHEEIWESIDNVYVREKVIDIITEYNDFNEEFIDLNGVLCGHHFCKTLIKEKKKQEEKNKEKKSKERKSITDEEWNEEEKKDKDPEIITDEEWNEEEKKDKDPECITDEEWKNEELLCRGDLKKFGYSNIEAFTYALTETKSGNCTYKNAYLNYIADKIRITDYSYSYKYFCEEVYIKKHIDSNPYKLD